MDDSSVGANRILTHRLRTDHPEDKLEVHGEVTLLFRHFVEALLWEVDRRLLPEEKVTIRVFVPYRSLLARLDRQLDAALPRRVRGPVD